MPKLQKKRGRKKKNTSPDAVVECPPTNAPNTSSAAEPASGGTGAGANGSNQNAPNQTSENPVVPSSSAANTSAGGDAPPVKCPPSKIVIREGGTSEPAIQLVGGKGSDQASQQRSSTDRLLESAESNLKKVAGQQLSTNQQEMVNQIQQFVEQSKAALSAGDLERGHNLAIKAQLLSNELVKP